MHCSWLGKTILIAGCVGAAALLGATFVFGLTPGTVNGAVMQGDMSIGVGYSQPTPTPTFCPVPTAERPPLVDPLISPTSLFTQTISVQVTRSDAITVTCESGVYDVHAGDDDWKRPAQVDINLLRNTIHHLTVTSRVPEFTIGGCSYHGYTLHTQVDSHGDPLVIEQVSPLMEYQFYLPLFLRTGHI